MAGPAMRARDATKFCVAVYVLAALFIDLAYALQLAAGGTNVGIGELPSTLFFFSIWAPLMPLIVYAARRFSFVRGRRLRSLEVHFAIALALSFVTLVAHKLVFCGAHDYLECITYYRAEAWMARWFGLDYFIYVAALAGIWILDSVEAGKQRDMRAALIERELANAELKLVNGQISPQFLRGVFDWLALEVVRDAGRAEAMITLVADYLRRSVHAIDVSGLTVADDIELSRAWLAIESARRRRRIDVLVEVPGEIQQTAIVAPVLQPLMAMIDLDRARMVRIGTIDHSSRLELSLDVDGSPVAAATLDHVRVGTAA